MFFGNGLSKPFLLALATHPPLITQPMINYLQGKPS